MSIASEIAYSIKLCNALGICTSSDDDRVFARIAELIDAEKVLKAKGLARDEFEAKQRRVTDLERRLDAAERDACNQKNAYENCARSRDADLEAIAKEAGAIVYNRETIVACIRFVKLAEKDAFDRAQRAETLLRRVFDAVALAPDERTFEGFMAEQNGAERELREVEERAAALRRELLEARQQVLDDDVVKTRVRNLLRDAGIPETEPLEHGLAGAICSERCLPLWERVQALVELYQDALTATQILNRAVLAATGGFDLRTLQVRLPWTIKYSGDFRANPQPHKDFAHALLHVMKASGMLAMLVDKMDHDRDAALDQDKRTSYAPYIADLVVCALRLANTFPGGPVDLERAVVDRIESKNGVTL